MNIKKIIEKHELSDFPIGLGGCRISDHYFDSCVHDLFVFDGKSETEEILRSEGAFIIIHHASLSETKSKNLLQYNKLQIIPPRLIQDPSSNLVLNSIGQGNGDIFKTVNSSNVNTIHGNSYQVWDYENEKSMNGGKYLDEVVGANPKNEEFMKIGDHKPNYSF